MATETDPPKPDDKPPGSILGGGAPPATTAKKPPAAEFKERRYTVQEDIQVPRGASSFMLRKGQEVSNAGHDIEALRKQGVKMKEIAGEK